MKLFLSIFFIFCFNGFSQSLKHNLSIQGGSNTIDKHYISHTIGAPILPGVYSNSNHTLIQGFEYNILNNNLLSSSTIIDNVSIEIPIYIYNSPDNILLIDGEEEIFPLDIYIYDLGGRLINILKNKKYSQREISLDKLNQAYYIVKPVSKTKIFNGVLIKNN